MDDYGASLGELLPLRATLLPFHNCTLEAGGATSMEMPTEE